MISQLIAPRLRRFWRLTLGLLVGVVSWFAFAPATGGGSIQHLDKVQHVAAFAALAGVAALAWGPGSHIDRRVAGALLGYGVFIELVQTQLPTRTASLGDVLADGIGIGLGLLLVNRLRRAA